MEETLTGEAAGGLSGEAAPAAAAVQPDVATPEAPTPEFAQTEEGRARPLVETAELPIGIALSRPRRGASVFQDQLVAANSAARADSLKMLATWFPGYDFDQAAQNVDGRRFSVISLGDALPDFLGDEESVLELMLEHEHAWGLGGISFSHGEVKGHQGPPGNAAVKPGRGGERGMVNAGGMAKALDDRWTAIINSADKRHRALAEICLHLTRAYSSPTNTNIYISYGPSKGFGAHWDTHDTIIVPLCGAKRWALFEPSVLSAQRPWVEPNVSEKPLWDGILERGMALVIPRGWGHRVDGSDDLSVHCTLGVSRLEVHNVLERVSFEAGYWPALRADMPFDPDEPVMSYMGSVFDSPQGFARAIAAVATPELVDRAIAAHRARITRPTFPSFRDTFRAVAFGDWSGLALRLIAPAGIMVNTETDQDSVLAFKGQAVRVAAEARDAFAALADTLPRRLGDLPAIGSGEADLRAEFARQLVACGLATVEPAA